MKPIDFVIIAVILLIVGGAVAYIIKAKKSGKKCIGCPDSASCAASHTKCSGNCSSCGGGCCEAKKSAPEAESPTDKGENRE
jgi:hypothetical protein